MDRFGCLVLCLYRQNLGWDCKILGDVWLGFYGMLKQFRSNWKYNKIIKNGVFNTSFDEIVCTTRAFSDVIHILESINTILLDSVWRIEHLRKSLLA